MDRVWCVHALELIAQPVPKSARLNAHVCASTIRLHLGSYFMNFIINWLDFSKIIHRNSVAANLCLENVVAVQRVKRSRMYSQWGNNWMGRIVLIQKRFSVEISWAIVIASSTLIPSRSTAMHAAVYWIKINFNIQTSVMSAFLRRLQVIMCVLALAALRFWFHFENATKISMECKW